jgi:hypothetical protein
VKYFSLKIPLLDGNVLYNKTVNTKSLVLSHKQEILFKVQEREIGTFIGFISDFNNIDNNDITVLEGYPDLINIIVDRNDIKMREHTFPNQGPLHEVAFSKKDFDFDISILIYKCNFENEESN